MPFVIFDLLFPIFSVFFWFVLLTTVTVPEATVNEDCDLLLKEDKVGMSFDVVVPAPASDAVFLKDLDELKFR